MQISCVFLTLTHVDICTALWDYALGHISCNDENDDADENTGEAGSPWVGGWGTIFCPCLCFNINQCSELRWCNWVFAEMVKGITSSNRDGFHCHVFLRGVYRRVYIQNRPLCSTFFCFTVQVGRLSRPKFCLECLF